MGTGQVVAGPDQLAEYFRLPPGRPLRIGAELEGLPVDLSTGESIPYAGERGIARILGLLSERYGWSGKYEGNKLIALERSGSTVTLEPGGQTELSTSPHPDLGELVREMRRFREELRAVSDELGVAFLGLGFHPFTPLADIEWMPKARYEIMRPYMIRHGDLAHHMMKGTASVQVAVDYEDENDMARKFRVAMALSPVVTAMFANSPVTEDKPNGNRSMRALAWTRTDPDRCGLIPAAFEPDFSFAAYTRHALAIPAMFGYTNGKWSGPHDQPFSLLMERGNAGRPVTMDDWDLHLTGIFTDVRLKKFIEIRCADAVPFDLALSASALWWGLLYDSDNLAHLHETTGRWTFDEVDALRAAVPRLGLAARSRWGKVVDIARDLVRWASDGLPEAHRRLLGPVRELLDDGVSPADRLLDAWTQDRETDLAMLLENNRY